MTGADDTMPPAIQDPPPMGAGRQPSAMPAPLANPEPQRQPGLDILRCVAVALVLASHFYACPIEVSPVLHQITTTLGTGGWVGVDLFFVLSGFLVSGLIFREWHKTGTVRIGRFMIRRTFKIVPPLYCFIGVSTVMYYLIHGIVPWKGVAGEVLFLQNYYHRLWQHTWSLAVEEHFYTLLAGVAAICLWQRSPWHGGWTLSLVLLGVCGLCLTLRIFNATVNQEYAEHVHMYKTHLRLDSLALGVLIASHWHRPHSLLPAWAARHRVWLVTLGSLGLAPFFFFDRQTHSLIYTAGFTLLAVCSGALVLGLVTLKPTRNRWVGALTFVGRNSYGIYLWHLAMPRWLGLVPGFQNVLPTDWWLVTAIYWVGAVVLGVLSTRLVETPFLALRNRWFQTPSA